MATLPDPPDDDGDDDAALALRLGLDPGDRLDKALARAAAEALPAGEAPSRTRIARAIAEGGVTCDGAPVAEAGARPAPGALYRVQLDPPPRADAMAQDIPLAVVWEDADLIVIDKAPGMVVHPAPGAPDGTLVNALLHRFGAGFAAVGAAARPGIVHRIDKDTSGLIVAARSDRALRHLAAQFAAHSVTRSYLAAVHGHPDPGDARLRGLPGVAVEPGGVIRIATQIGRHPTDRQRQAVLAAGGRHAITRLRVRAPLGAGAALVECRLETGRTHQIRVHLAHAGHPLIGDPVYGGHRRLPARLPGAAPAAAFPRQALHAAELGFDHPVTGERLHFASALPPDMVGLVAALRGT